ncbi:hypothetical protein [Streptomyces sp. NPDC007074]|uniref:hypothetical protein n=1 Tax=Streptomyces sp. NPDC007074 TaxID=3156764 RepID=UPI00340A2957
MPVSDAVFQWLVYLSIPFFVLVGVVHAGVLRRRRVRGVWPAGVPEVFVSRSTRREFVRLERRQRAAVRSASRVVEKELDQVGGFYDVPAGRRSSL